ncbi:MAG: hypothetical protein HBSAPP04_04260 [Ignavibacteriaceae bacterium]|nr:MAG: hypothetical protein HBSAPP04_04260 [Ignavibacteriaceae bacterium]
MKLFTDRLHLTSELQVLQTFSKNIRYYRKLQNISQEELGFRSGLHRTYIGLIERAERTATIISLEKIATALGVSYNDLLTVKADYSVLNGKRVRRITGKHAGHKHQAETASVGGVK